ncbi:hypothetical protein COOONC_08422 [Cooperia oncophora]
MPRLAGETCSGDADEALKTMEKRKPNFMRFGRSVSFGKKGSDPNFLRFGRNQPNFLRFGKAAGDPNFLRFGELPDEPVVIQTSCDSVNEVLTRISCVSDVNQTSSVLASKQQTITMTILPLHRSSP